MHVPQSVQTMNELKDFALVPYHIIGPKDGKPIIEVVQDTMVGSFRLTKDDVKINDKTFANLQMVNSYFDGNLQEPNDKKTREYTGRQASSAIIPPGLHIKINNRLNETININNSVHTTGILDKNVFHSMSNGLLPVIYHDYNPFEVRRFLDNLQRLICRWLLTSGFSVGISDLVVEQTTKDTLKNIITEMKTKAYGELEKVRNQEMENNSIFNNQDFFEQTMINILNGAASKVEKSGLENIHHQYNRMINMVRSGSKGKDTNVAQMIAAVGQQNVDGKRVAYGFTDRTLPHYNKYDDGPAARGFVENSFINGLTPQEMFFHAMGGREGLIDTAVKSVTGNTPIVIMENGKTKYVEIGEWIDNYMELYPTEIAVEDDRPDLEFLKIDDKVSVYIPTVDEKGSVFWGELTAVTRHDPTEVIYEIETAGGRRVTVADSESLLIWDNETEGYYKKHSSLVKIGDNVPVTTKMVNPSQITEYIDMTEYFSKKSYVYGTDFNKCVKEMKEAQGNSFHIPKNWYEENNGNTFTLPYISKARVQRVTVRSCTENIKDGCIYPYHATREHSHLPDKFILDYENGIMCGIYLADGCIHEKSGTISITKDDKSIQEFVCKWFDKYNITYRIDNNKNDYGTSTSIIGSSTLFAKFFKILMGQGARKKQIPDVSYNAPVDFVKGLLNGYISGDGSIERGDSITASSSSKQLIEGIIFLLSRIGVFGKLTISQLKYNNFNTIDIAPSYRLSIRAQWASIFRNEIDLIHSIKKVKLRTASFSEKHINFKELNDTVMDKIIKITKQDGIENCSKMYDVTVPSTLNFITASGLGLNDTSETGYIQRRLVKAMEDAKIHYDYTVRNAASSIIQFVYGEDGIEGTKIEKQTIPYIDMDVVGIYNKYMINEQDNMKLLLTDKAYEEFKKDKSFKKDMEKYLEQIIEDKKFLIEKIFKGEQNNKIEYPIPFARIINNAYNRMKDMGLDSLPSNVTPKYILDKMNTLISGKDSLYIIDNNQGIEFLYILIRANISPKDFICKYHMQKETVDWIFDEIKRYFIEAIAAPGEMVGIIAAQSFGEPVTQLSNRFDTRIRVVSKNNQHTGKIGDFIDRLLEENKEDVIELGHNSTALYLKDDYFIIGVSDNEKTSWRRILEVSRHPANGGLVTVKTRSGRKTTATLSHSFLKRTKEGSIIPIEGSKLSVGDRIPVTRNIPTIDNPLKITWIDNNCYVLDKDFGWIIGAYLADGCATSNVIISKIEPVFEERLREFANDNGFTLTIRKQTGNFKNAPIYKDRIYESKSMRIGGERSYALAKWFINNFGTGSYNKSIPGWVYASNKEFIAGIISGYFDGDGNVNVEKHMIRCHSVCEGLIEDISILLNYCGVFAVKLIERRKREKANLFHVLSISKKYAELFDNVIGFHTEYKSNNLKEIIKYNNRDNVHDVRDVIDLIPECGESIAYIGERLKLPGQSRTYKRWLKKRGIGRRTLEKYIALFKAANDLQGNLPDVKSHIDILEQAVNADVIWDEIIELEYLPDPQEFVYDFTVPGNDSFMVDNGILVHNTLDSFHVSGTAAAVKATSGVPRLKELLSVSKNIKTPTLTIYLKPDISSVSNYTEDKEGNVSDVRLMEAKEKTLKVLHQLEITRIYDILESTEIYWDPPSTSGLNSSIENDNEILAVYREFAKVNANTEKCNSLSPWVIRMKFSKEKLKIVHLTMIDIYMKIYQNYENVLDCIFSDDNDKELIFHMRIYENAIKDVDSEDMVAALKAFEYNIVHTILLKGIQKIKKVSMRQNNRIKYNSEIQKFEKVSEWILDTDGSNFIEIISNPNIDSYRTKTNDINEIYSVLGIEAARNALYEEMMDVIKESSLNYRHLSLLVDTMTCKGALMSIDRHGINRGDVGPLAKSSFEETTDMLIKASIFSDIDRINGVSANIMLGQLPPCGTGFSEILLDEEEFVNIIKDKTNFVRQQNVISEEDNNCSVEMLEIPSITTKRNTRTKKLNIPDIIIE